MMQRFWRRFRIHEMFARRRAPAPVLARLRAAAVRFKPAADTDGRKRRMRQAAEDNRLL